MQSISHITIPSTSHWHPRLEIRITFLLLFVLFVPDALSSSWENIPLTGDIPSPRCDHSMVRIGDLYYIYGGREVSSDVKSLTKTTAIYDDLYTYTPSENYCRKITPTGTTPPKLCGHTALVHNNQMYVLFGHKGATEQDPTSGPSNDVYRYDPATNTWGKVQTSGSTPPARVYSAGVSSITRVWISGGTQSITRTASCSDSWIFYPETSSWEQKGTIPQAGRYGHAMVMDASRNVHILGGRNEYGVQYSGWRYNPKTNTWTETHLDNAPPPVSNSITFWTYAGLARFYRIGGYGYPSSFSKSTNKDEWEKIVGEVWKLDLTKMEWEYQGNVDPIAYGAGAFFDDPGNPNDVPRPIFFGGVNEDEVPVNTMTLYDPEGEGPTSSVGKESLRWYE